MIAAAVGLPDNGTADPDGKDPHQGPVALEEWTDVELLVGGHCGAGAPRFNVTDTANNTYFVGCAGGTHVTAPQDPGQWERVTFSASTDGFPPTFIFGVTPVKSIDIVFDEGTDSTSTDDPNGVGLAVLDNIRINNTVIRNKKGAIITP